MAPKKSKGIKIGQPYIGSNSKDPLGKPKKGAKKGKGVKIGLATTAVADGLHHSGGDNKPLSSLKEIIVLARILLSVVVVVVLSKLGL